MSFGSSIPTSKSLVTCILTFVIKESTASMLNVVVTYGHFCAKSALESNYQHKEEEKKSSTNQETLKSITK